MRQVIAVSMLFLMLGGIIQVKAQSLSVETKSFGWGAQNIGFTSPGRYEIEVVASGKFLDLSRGDRPIVQQWSHSNARHQQWDIEDAGGGYYYIRSAENGRALEAEERDGGQVWVASRDGNDYRGNESQRWQIRPINDREVTIISRRGKALDMPLGQTQDGVTLQVWNPSGRENQRFRFHRVGGRDRDDNPRRPDREYDRPLPGLNVSRGRYEIESIASGKVLDLRRDDQRILQQWSRSRARNQQWEIEPTRDGYYTIRSAENSFYLGVENRFGRDGAWVSLFPRGDGDQVKWQFADAGRGQVLIISKSSGRALELPNGQSYDGVRLQVGDQTGRDNQRFRLARAESVDDNYGRGNYGGRDDNRVSGSLRWRGRVDHEVILEIRGSTVRERLIAGTSFNNGRYTFSAPLPRREVNLRIEERKVRGSVEIIERPSSANNFTVLIRIRDPKSDAADYEFDLIWN